MIRQLRVIATAINRMRDRVDTVSQGIHIAVVLYFSSAMFIAGFCIGVWFGAFGS